MPLSFPLDGATAKNRVEVMEVLIANGADVNISIYRSPLHTAVLYNCIEAARLLIANGADVNLKSRIHGTPLSVAISVNEQEMVTLLRSYGAVE